MKEYIKWANENQGFIMALLTFVYVAATLWLVWLAHGQLRHSTELERSRTRPFVLFDLVLDRHHVFATIKNLGQTPAFKVRISVTPNIQCLIGGEKTVPAEERALEIAFIARGIEMLAPQRSITSLMGHWTRIKSAHRDLRFNGTVSYSSADGIAYSEPFVADLSAHDGLLYLGTKTIEDVAKHLEAVAVTLGHIATGYKKPLVRTMTQADFLAEQISAVNQTQSNVPSADSHTTNEPI